jgi:hypothetical protein
LKATFAAIFREPGGGHIRESPMSTWDYELQRCTRRCAAQNRELKPGEPIYSVLIRIGAEVVRQDFSAEAWEGPPPEAIGWWRAQVPDPHSGQTTWAPNDVMLQYFLRSDADEQPELRYVLALLMVRRRVLRWEDTEVSDDGREVFVLYCPQNDTDYRVPVVEPAPSRAEEIERTLSELLFGPSGSS